MQQELKSLFKKNFSNFSADHVIKGLSENKKAPVRKAGFFPAGFLSTYNTQMCTVALIRHSTRWTSKRACVSDRACVSCLLSSNCAIRELCPLYLLNLHLPHPVPSSICSRGRDYSSSSSLLSHCPYNLSPTEAASRGTWGHTQFEQASALTWDCPLCP